MSQSNYYIGLISGTSIDGVDCALINCIDNKPRLLATHSEPIPALLKNKILNLCANENISLDSLGQVDIEIGRLFAAAVNKLLLQEKLSAESICAIGSHGQTVFHQPAGEFPFSMQIGDANTIAELTGITTVADFRRRDMAAGGQGAPLAPLLHQCCFSSESHSRVILNIGGISNPTILNGSEPCIAFDSGPGNVLMDYWINLQQAKPYDESGKWAASGKIDTTLLNLLAQESYFDLAPPKSTGRELFNSEWLNKKLQQLTSQPDPADVQATLLELTATSISNAIEKIMVAQELYVCGGGAHNSTLMRRLAELLPDTKVATTAQLGIDPDWVEAAAFAWLAKQTIEGTAIDTRSITGARRAAILGGIYQA